MKKRAYKKSMDFVVETSIRVLGISRHDAEQRVKALLKSGIMDGGRPSDLETQKKIDMFMQGIGRPIKYFTVYSEQNPEGPGLLYGIQGIRDHGFSFVLKLDGGIMWVKDKAEAEKAVRIFDEQNKIDPIETAQLY